MASAVVANLFPMVLNRPTMGLAFGLLAANPPWPNLFGVGRGVTIREVVCRTTGLVVGRTVAGLGAAVPNSAAGL